MSDLDTLAEQSKTDPIGAAVEMAKGLMRGDQATLKAGYTLANALIAAAEMFRIVTITQLAIVAERVVNEPAVGTVILVETNGAEPENTTKLRGSGVEVISIDWDEVERGDNPQYIRDILDRIEELGVGEDSPVNHVGMLEIRKQLMVALDEKQTDGA